MLLGEHPVRLGREVEVRVLAAFGDDLILVGGVPNRYGSVRDIWDFERELPLTLLYLANLGLQSFDRILEPAGGLDAFLRLIGSARAHELADGLRDGI